MVFYKHLSLSSLRLHRFVRRLAFWSLFKALQFARLPLFVRRFFNLDKSDDVRKFVIRREVVPKKEGAKPYTKA